MKTYIQNHIKFISKYLKNKDVFAVLLIIMVGISSFGLGRMSVGEEGKNPIKTEYFSQNNTESRNIASPSQVIESLSTGEVVASRNGSKYHLPWCSGAQRMNEENKIWFTSIEEAKLAGYTPAANCKGLK